MPEFAPDDDWLSHGPRTRGLHGPSEREVDPVERAKRADAANSLYFMRIRKSSASKG
jgi:hypothetical protein